MHRVSAVADLPADSGKPLPMDIPECTGEAVIRPAGALAHWPAGKREYPPGVIEFSGSVRKEQ